MENKKLWIGLAIIVIGFFGVVIYRNNTKEPEPQNNGSSNVYGKLDSPVVLTEFVDFQCEACYAFYPTIKDIKEKYKDSVKFQIKNFPIANSHQYARMAASYAEAAARQGKFFDMHDKIFEGQKIWERSQDPRTYFDSYAKEIGLDETKLQEELKSAAVNATINADLAEVKRLGGDGTPTFLLNGKKIDNPENSVEAFSALLDEALKQADTGA